MAIHSIRTNDIFRRIITGDIWYIKSVFDQSGHEIRIAGGAPRDILSGKIPNDLDFATTATPDEMVAMFTEKEIRMINSNGIKHGTVTAHINGINYEITTLRIDRITDGRHAEVEFTRNWEIDSNRRDLTVNSLFLTFDGEIIDYHNGVEDIESKRVRFVGKAAERIQEDYLRILRYFRFYSRICVNGSSHEDETLNAIETNCSGLENISGERIWAEMAKILIQPYSFEFLELIYKLGIADYIGLPRDGLQEDSALTEFVSTHPMSQAMVKIASLVSEPGNILEIDSRLKFSKKEYELAYFIVGQKAKIQELMPDFRHWNEESRFSYYFKLKVMFSNNILTDEIYAKADPDWVVQLAILFREGEEFTTRLTSVSIPMYPGPMATELTDKYRIERGPLIGLMLTRLKEKWMQAEYTSSSENVASNILKILEEFRLEGIVDDQNKIIKRRAVLQKGPGVKKKKQMRKN